MSVRYESDGKYKEMMYSDKQRPCHYVEDVIAPDKDYDYSERKSIEYNDAGMVVWAS